jgi:hypothetical protein
VFFVSEVETPALGEANDLARILNVHGLVGVTMVDEDGHEERIHGGNWAAARNPQSLIKTY